MRDHATLDEVPGPSERRNKRGGLEGVEQGAGEFWRDQLGVRIVLQLLPK